MASIMAPSFPSFVMITLYGYTDRVAATGAIGGVDGAVHNDTAQGKFNPMAKIEIETAKVDSRYVHIRFTHTNKYWCRNYAEGRHVAALSTEPEEDRSKPSCTLFEPVPSSSGDGTGFTLIHVQSGEGVRVESSGRYSVNDSASNTRTFIAVDWDSVVRLPLNVAFKNDGKYLRYYKQGNSPPYLQFSSDDPNAQESVQQLELKPDGSVRIKSVFTGGFWRLQPDWIIPDSQTDSPDTRYMPFRGQEGSIFLKNVSNGYFCRSLIGGGLTNVLNARAPTMINEARMEVEELVSQRNIYNVTYRMDEARIYNQRPYVAGESRLRNDTDQVASQSVSITYEDGKAYTFSRGFSTTAGVSTTISTGVPFIAGGEITISFEISGSFNWDTTTTTTTSLTATTQVPVPPNSTIVVKYVGTQGTCSIPYSYTQQDRSSINGQIVHIPQVDGVYNGVSCYNFDFEMDEAMPL